MGAAREMLPMLHIALFALAAAEPPAPALAPAPIEGRWRSPGGNSIIDIAPCGAELCGTLAWASAKAKKDSQKTTDQLVGTQLLTGLRQDKDRWLGKLFVPDKNLRVTAKIAAVGAGQLKVSGCAAGRALCKSELWTRVEGPLPAAE